MKSDKLILYIIESALIIFLLCSIIFNQVLTKTIMAIILLFFMLISMRFIKSYKVRGRYNKKITSTMIIIGIVYISALYVLGIYVGFYNATVKLSTWSLINYIIPYIVIIISIENIRKTILLKEDKKSNIIILIATILLDIALGINIYAVNSLNDYFTLIGFILFSSIANNILYNYIITKHRNCKAIIAYKLITIIYVYIIPIIPNILILFETIIRIVVPYIIYLVLEAMYSKKQKNLSTTVTTKDVIITVSLTIIATVIIMLISCVFRFGVLVIGSGSMTGTINKGDAIIYERLGKEEVIEIGDIIVFKNDGVRVIHRVIDKKDSGSGMKYYTKGDANPNEDEGYRVEEDVIGKVRLRIPYIGQLTVKLNEMFENGGQSGG